MRFQQLRICHDQADRDHILIIGSLTKDAPSCGTANPVQFLTSSLRYAEAQLGIQLQVVVPWEQI